MIRIGTSGWSYPSWRPGFYPGGLQPAEFLGYYAERFDTVELNATGYRLPSEDQFKRWAEAVPDGFKFAVKLPLTRLDRVTPFLERVLALGDRLGPVRVVVEAARDDGLVSFVTGSTPPTSSWRGTSATSPGTAPTESCASATLRPSRFATYGCASRRTRTTSCRPSPRRYAIPPTSTCGTRTSRRRPQSPTACAR